MHRFLSIFKLKQPITQLSYPKKVSSCIKLCHSSHYSLYSTLSLNLLSPKLNVSKTISQEFLWNEKSKMISKWLFLSSALVFGIVIIGGLTRLTVSFYDNGHSKEYYHNIDLIFLL